MKLFKSNSVEKESIECSLRMDGERRCSPERLEEEEDQMVYDDDTRRMEF